MADDHPQVAAGSRALELRHDIAVIGAGPAGSALAALLARQGRDVALLEKDFFPRDKLCGEFLSTESQKLLKEIGCLDALLARRPARITQSRFFTPAGRCIAMPLPGEALGLSRTALDEILFRHAARSGAAAYEGARVAAIHPGRPQTAMEVEFRDGSDRLSRVLRTSLAVGAYGRRSRLDRQLGRPFIDKNHPFIGLKRHHRPSATAAGRQAAAELRDSVEIHAFDGGYGGISGIEDDQLNVCFLLTKRFLDKIPSADWRHVRTAVETLSQSLSRRLDALVPSEEAVHAVAQVPFDRKETSSGPVLFLGDAAAVIAPLCGDGQAMALRSAVLLAARINQTPSARWNEELSGIWKREWEAEFGGRIRLGRLLQDILLRPAACEAAGRIIRLFPGLGSFLVKATRG